MNFFRETSSISKFSKNRQQQKKERDMKNDYCPTSLLTISSILLYISAYIVKESSLNTKANISSAESHNIFSTNCASQKYLFSFDNPTIWDLLIASKKNVNNFKIVSMNVFLLLLIYLIHVDLMVRVPWS